MTGEKGRMIERFTKIGITLNQDAFFEVIEPESMQHFAASGYGISFASRCMRNDTARRNMVLPNLSAIPIDDSNFRAGAYLSRVESKVHSRSAALFWDFMIWFGAFSQQNGIFPTLEDYENYQANLRHSLEQ